MWILPDQLGYRSCIKTRWKLQPAVVKRSGEVQYCEWMNTILERKMDVHSDGTHPRASASMRNTEGFVKVQVRHICTVISRPTQSHLYTNKR